MEHLQPYMSCPPVIWQNNWQITISKFGKLTSTRLSSSSLQHSKYHSSVTCNVECIAYKPSTTYANPRGLSQEHATGPLWNHALRSTKADAGLGCWEKLGLSIKKMDWAVEVLRILDGLVWNLRENTIPSMGQSSFSISKLLFRGYSLCSVTPYFFSLIKVDFWILAHPHLRPLEQTTMPY